jgi:tetratricopeptide (TPR) repeat protein
MVARLDAAVSQALGQGYGMSSDRIDEQWLEPLAQAAVFFARHPSQAHMADQIMNHWRFQQSDNCRQVRKAAAEMLQADIDKLTPQQIQRLVNWIMPNDPAVEKDTWKRLAAGLLTRWAASADTNDKRAFGQTLVLIYANRLDAPEYLAFLRRQLKDAPRDLRAQYAGQLFDALTVQAWSQELEDEALGMIENLSNADEPSRRFASAVMALHIFDDRMGQARYNAKAKALEHPEALTRTELMARQTEHLRLAREELADRLGREMAKRSGPIVKWFDAERLYLNVQAGRDLAKAAPQCWEILGPQPRKVDLDTHPELLLDEILRHRMLVTLSNLACRKNADPALVGQLFKYIDQGIDLDKDNPQWKLLKYQLLIALDRPKDLEEAVQGWIRADDPDNRWKVSLGYLLAEQGKLADAIKLFEAVAAADELGPAEYRSLADWYLAVNRRQQYERAMIDTYKMTDEWQLSNYLYQRLRPWQQEPSRAPAELDEQMLLVFAALFEKSADPRNHLGRLTEYYQATRDFRLLSGLADAVIGHTAGQVYPFLQNMGGTLSEVRDEATADSITEHLAKKVRQRATTAIDQRALDLLEALVERRAAELINQPGPHGDKAVAALKRAFQRAFSPGEPRLLADLLGSLGAIAYKPLADEQVRQLEALHRDAAKGSADRLLIAHRLANAYWCYARQDQAIDLLTDALGEFEKASGGVLPPSANEPLGTLVGYLESRRHYARGEKVLLEQLTHPAHQQQRLWLTQRLYELYVNAVRNGGDVSLGSGSTLYKAAERKMLADLANPDQNFRYNLVSRLCSLYRAGHERKFTGVLGDLHRFAFENIPEMLKRQTTNYQSVVSTVKSTLRDLAGPREALAFLIERIEQEPSWFRWNNQDGWNSYSWDLGRYRQEVKNLGDLDGRLLKIVLTELKRELKSRMQRNRAMYDCRQGDYWAEKAQDFSKAAEEVYAETKGSGTAVAYIAQYLYWGLRQHDRAIEILFIANNAKLLDESGQWRLVKFLHNRERYGESVALLQFLVEWRPDNMSYRVALMHAYFRTTRQAELLGLLKQTDEHFHKDGRWTESALAALAASCLQNQLYEQSVDYYKELIPLHQRTAARRGIGDGTLSNYYGGMARAYAGLKNTVEAVDAACGAIISWGRNQQNRSAAVGALLAVVRQAPDLDDFVADLDKQAAETGLHNPIVRKAVGQVYLEKKQYAKAIAQLSLACQLQPNDLETNQALLACYDRKKDQPGAIRQILQTLQAAPREITLYANLGKRFAAIKEPVQAQRAYTSMVEALPSESESHAALAEILQKQDRWADAAEQWTQVARIRALEPTGLLGLAAAQAHLKQWDQAAETIKKLRARSWPTRFGNVDGQVRGLEQQVELGRNQSERLPS